MLNVYGEPDDILVMEAEDGGDSYLVVVDFKTGCLRIQYEKWTKRLPRPTGSNWSSMHGCWSASLLAINSVPHRHEGRS